ncbi:MAG: DUF4038 domain-containing protein [Gemmatimonadota bacterium]
MARPRQRVRLPRGPLRRLPAPRPPVPRLPWFLVETAYEGEHQARPERIRRQAWWPLLGGACGQVYGSSPVYHFGSRGVYDQGGDWQAALDSRGARDLAVLARFWRPLPWWRLRPGTDDWVLVLQSADAAQP